MHGISHLYRQHAVEKQMSSESWQQQSTSSNNSYGSNSMQRNDSNEGPVRLNSLGSGSSSSSSKSSKSPNWSQDKDKVSSPPQPVPDYGISHFRNSPSSSTATSYCRGSYDSYSSNLRRTPSSRRNFFERCQSPGVYNSFRRSIGESYGSPPVQTGFFPHDLDDIYENNVDHQYFTHTGACQSRREERPSINSIFHRVGAAYSLDDYKASVPDGSPTAPGYRHRFDNSSFAKSISGEENASSPKSHKSQHHHHHHHSIQEMLKTFGKKVHIWPRKSHDTNSACTSPMNDPQESFRMRSKSLDANTVNRNRILNDCEATYKIYDRIVKEGKHNERAAKWRVLGNLDSRRNAD